MKTNFWKTKNGLMVMTIICYAIVWGLLLSASTGTPIALVVVAVCVYFGWNHVTFINPSWFAWLGVVGDALYIVVKLGVTWIAGLFISPYFIAKRIIQKLTNQGEMSRSV